jgi:hypothetical protein
VEGPGDDDLKGGATEAADLAGEKLDARKARCAWELGWRDRRERRKGNKTQT